jgi:hypothetical protein
VRVNFATKTATVTLRLGKSLSKERCDEVFRGTPYRVSSFEETVGEGLPSG